MVLKDGDIIQSSLSSDLGAPLPLHISLSRPIGLGTEEKDGFTNSLARAVKSSGIRPYAVIIPVLDMFLIRADSISPQLVLIGSRISRRLAGFWFYGLLNREITR